MGLAGGLATNGQSGTSVSGGGGLLAANNLSDVASKPTSLSNLGGAPTANPTFTGTVTAASLLTFTGNAEFQTSTGQFYFEQTQGSFAHMIFGNGGAWSIWNAAGTSAETTLDDGGGNMIVGGIVTEKGTKTGAITSGALPTVTLTSGTGAQILTTRDVTLAIAVTATLATGTVLVQLSPDGTTYSTLVTATPGVLNGVDLVTVPTPAGWYVKLTSSNATYTCTYY